MTSLCMEQPVSAIGVDKIVLSTIAICSVDWLKYCSHPNTTLKPAVESQSRCIGNQNIKTLRINGNHYVLEIGVAFNQHHELMPYEKLELNPAAILYGCNLENVSNPNALQEALDMVTVNLDHEFGIAVDLSAALIRRIEINRNITLDHSFHCYGRIFSLIVDTLPKSMRMTQHYKDSGESTGFKAGNGEISLKFYDKQREAKIVIDCSGKTLRVEYSFLNNRKIISQFGFDSMAMLLSNFDIVSTVWRGNIENDILRRIPEALNRESKRHYDKLIQAIDEQPKSYIDKWLALSQGIFDVELLRKVLVKRLTAGTSVQNIKKRLKQLDRSAEQRQKNEIEIFYGQLSLLEEVLDKLKV